MSVAESSLDFLLIETVDHFCTADPDSAYAKLEQMGYRVGQSLAEKYTVDRPRFVDTLDVIKFVCKEFWIAVFQKQIDHLKTNHRGVYVLTDNSFRWLRRCSAENMDHKRFHTALPCGLLRGALAQLGVQSQVNVDIAGGQCIFQLKIK
ncbi:NO signaling/Golgi transport ligand-binding domain-containing protein [Gorgonomyces haynaldii]|nr:NO signaling/Golgi transport ligand-binding domain-containing protein [Gorgonomyces haynaldii]